MGVFFQWLEGCGGQLSHREFSGWASVMDDGCGIFSRSSSPCRSDIRTRNEPASSLCSLELTTFLPFTAVIRTSDPSEIVINGIRINDGAQYLFTLPLGGTGTFLLFRLTIPIPGGTAYGFQGVGWFISSIICTDGSSIKMERLEGGQMAALDTTYAALSANYA